MGGTHNDWYWGDFLVIVAGGGKQAEVDIWCKMLEVVRMMLLIGRWVQVEPSVVDT